MKLPPLNLADYEPYRKATERLGELQTQLIKTDADLQDASAIGVENRQAIQDRVRALTTDAPPGARPAAATAGVSPDVLGQLYEKAKLLRLAVEEQERICRRLAGKANAHLVATHNLRGLYETTLRKIFAAAHALGKVAEEERRFREALVEAEVAIPFNPLPFEIGPPEIDANGNKSPLVYWLETCEAGGYKVH